MDKVAASDQDGARPGRGTDYLRFYFLVVLFGLCVLFYYFGEIVDRAGWESLRWGVFYSVHDFHRLLFMAPVVYAAYFFGTKALVILVILTTASLLPRALFFSPFPDPLLRSMVFVAIAAVVGWVVARTRGQALRFKRERDSLLAGRDETSAERRR